MLWPVTRVTRYLMDTSFHSWMCKEPSERSLNLFSNIDVKLQTSAMRGPSVSRNLATMVRMKSSLLISWWWDVLVFLCQMIPTLLRVYRWLLGIESFSMSQLPSGEGGVNLLHRTSSFVRNGMHPLETCALVISSWSPTLPKLNPNTNWVLLIPSLPAVMAVYARLLYDTSIGRVLTSRGSRNV